MTEAGAYPDQFIRAESWVYETRCRKCGCTALREFSKVHAAEWQEFHYQVNSLWHCSTEPAMCSTCKVMTMQEVIAYTPQPENTGQAHVHRFDCLGDGRDLEGLPGVTDALGDAPGKTVSPQPGARSPGEGTHAAGHNEQK